MNRRALLKSLGLVGAATVTPPVFLSGGKALASTLSPTQNSDLRVGILVPGSKSRSYSSNFLNGFYFALDEQRQDGGKAAVLPVVHEIGTGYSSAAKGLQKLVDSDGVRVAIGLMNSRVSQMLAPIVANANIRFIEANLGENFFHPNFASDQYYHSSLNLWPAQYTLGKWTAENLGKTAVCATSFHDSAFDSFYAFLAGFAIAGGTVVRTLISGDPGEMISPVATAALAAQENAEILFANFSGSDASVFLNAFKNTSGSRMKKIVASPMMIQPRVLQHIGSNAEGLISAHSYVAQPQDAGADSFARAYRAKYGPEPDDFAVLGYDTAMLCSNAMRPGNSFVRATINSPRGVISMNGRTHALEGQISLVEMRTSASGLAPHCLETIDLSREITSSGFRLTEQIRSGAISHYPIS